MGPEHAHLAKSGRAQYVPVTDEDALRAFQLLSRHEGIIPALESSHALAYALRRAAEHPKGAEPLNILVSLSGRGDKDVAHVRATLDEHADWVIGAPAAADAAGPATEHAEEK